jgi:glycerol kinase
MGAPLLLAIDQGTSGTKAILVDRAGMIVARGVAPVGETHPHPGWVEQDPTAIWHSVQHAVAACLDGQDTARVAAVGLSTQRESVVLWDRLSGEPLTPVISWQDQRTAALCDTLRNPEVERLVRARSGLPLDPMFSAVKAAWLLQHNGPAAKAARAGRLVIGTIDAWLLSRFAKAPTNEAVIELGNASRTQLLNVPEARWDDDLLNLFGIPRAALPRLTRSTGPFPASRGLPPLADGTPVLAVMGDSHAALFAHGAFAPGQVKATYGTGSSVMGRIAHPEALDAGACLTIGWQTDDDPEVGPAFAAEGNIRATGAALRWMAGILGMSVEAMTALGAGSDSRGAVLVPGFTGLGAPWWDRDAVGLLTNLALDTGPAELARAAMEAVVHQVADVVDVIGRNVGTVRDLFTDGGPSRNADLMQMQADALGCDIHRSEDAELSALGVAHMAGLGAGFWNWEALRALPRPRDTLTPRLDETSRARQRAQWQAAVNRARSGAAGRAPIPEPGQRWPA